MGTSRGNTNNNGAAWWSEQIDSEFSDDNFGGAGLSCISGPGVVSAGDRYNPELERALEADSKADFRSGSEDGDENPELAQAIALSVAGSSSNIEDDDSELAQAIALSVADSKSIIENAEKLLAEEVGRYGFSLINVFADGKCFYHAVARQLEGFTSEGLQKLVQSHLFSHREIYPISNTEREIKNITASGVEADHVQILALARELNITIAIIHHDRPNNPTIIKRPNSNNTVYLGHQAGVGAHYQSLRRDKNPISERYNIDRLIHEAVSDIENYIVPARDNPVSSSARFFAIQAAATSETKGTSQNRPGSP
jgi:hypothetical protein